MILDAYYKNTSHSVWEDTSENIWQRFSKPAVVYRYKLEISDTSGNHVATITDQIENVTLTELRFKYLRNGGCSFFSFTLAEPYTTRTIEIGYKVDIYILSHLWPWFKGYIETVPETGTEKIQKYTGWGYSQRLEQKIINTTKTGMEISEIATSILDSDIIPNYPDITKNTNKIENTGYTIAGTLQFERQKAIDVFKKLAELANDYEFGIDEEGDFYFRANDTVIREYFWVGKHIGEFKPEKDPKNIVNKWYIYSPPFSDGSSFQITKEDATSQSSYGLREDVVDAPELINVYSSINLASGITPTTSPAGSGAANMTDGDYSTLWESNSPQSVGNYIKIDLGSIKENVAKVVLDQIHTSAQDYHSRGFKIEVSTDDSSYTEVFSSSGDPGWKPTITFQPISARYIKITCTVADTNEWKVGELEIYQLDTSDLSRWGDHILSESKDPTERAVITIPAVDQILESRFENAPIKPRGRIKIFSEDGTTTYTYDMISCEYVISPEKFDLTIECGDTKPQVGDWIKNLERKLREYRLLGIRTAGNIASGTGLQQGGIKATFIGEDVIETPHLATNAITTEKLDAGAVTADKMTITDLIDVANIFTLASGRVIIAKDAFGTDLEGIIVNDGTYNRVEIGELTAGNYGGTFRDSNGIKTIDLGALQGIWKKIYDYELTSAATSLTVSGLNGNVDGIYMIEYRVVNGYAGSTGMHIRINNDSGANYGWQFILGNSTTASANRYTSNTAGLWMLDFHGANRIGYARTLLFAKSGYRRSAITESAYDIYGTTVENIVLVGQVWDNTSSNITSLVFYALDTNGLGAGTHITIFKRV